MTIEDSIIKPLQDSIDGTGQLMRFPMTQTAREVVRHGDAAELHPNGAVLRDVGRRLATSRLDIT